jgi:hypothetical protein
MVDGVSPDTAALLGRIVVAAKTVLACRPFHQPNVAAGVGLLPGGFRLPVAGGDRRWDGIARRGPRQVLVANLRHRAIDVAIKAKPRHRGLLQAHAPQRPRIEPRRAAGIRDRGAEAESGPDKRAAGGNRPEARFEPGRGQARCENARYVLDRLIGRHGAVAVAGDRRRAALPRDRLRRRCGSGNADLSPSPSMIEPMQARSPPSQRWQPTKAASCVVLRVHGIPPNSVANRPDALLHERPRAQARV